MKTTILYIILISLCVVNTYGQLSAPGLGDAKMASWLALGLRQNLNNEKTFESLTYVGIGQKETENTKIFKSSPAIIVLNQEVYHKLNDDWKISLAASYRKQNDYFLDESTQVEKINVQQEFRLYGRASYNLSIGSVKLTQTFRQEVRRFMDFDFNNVDKLLELRSRFKSQISTNINNSTQHEITAGAEILFSSVKEKESNNFTKLAYNESRITLFYTYRPKNTPIALSVGYMNNLIETNKTHAVHYASFDLIIENPFSFFNKS